MIRALRFHPSAHPAGWGTAELSPQSVGSGLVFQRTYLLGVLIPNLRHSFWLHTVLGMWRLQSTKEYRNDMPF